MDQKLRVFLANDSFPPQIDGVANTVINYAKIIEKQYGTSMVAVPSYPDVKDEYDFEVVRYPSLHTEKLVGYRSGNPFTPVAMKKMSDFTPDIIHSHCPFSSSCLCRELRDVAEAPLVFTYHTKFDIDIRRALKLGIMQDVALKFIMDNISASDEVWVVNRGAGQNLRSLGYNGIYRIMPNGVEFPKGRAEDDKIKALRAELGVGDEEFVFLFVGRMLWYKGQKIILDGAKNLASKGYKFKLIFVGSGDNLADMEKYAASLGIADICRFRGAITDRELLRVYYSMADLFILPSVFDNNPIVCKEAAACGTASMLIDGSSSAEGVTDGRNALLIKESYESLASTLETAMNTPGLFETLGANAQNELYVSWDEMMRIVTQRYRDIIDAWNRGDIRRKPVITDLAYKMLGDVQTTFDILDDIIRNLPRII